MQKHNHIKALFFLGIFSLMLLHQVVPHWHHKYDVGHTHKTVVHNDNHTHHHDTPKKEDSKKGFLAFFLDVHVHSIEANEITLRHQKNIKKHNVKKDISTPISVNYYTSTNYDSTENVVIYHPPNNYFNPFLLSLTSRGPPILG